MGQALTLSKLDVTRGVGPGRASHLIRYKKKDEGLKGNAFSVSHLKTTPTAALAWDYVQGFVRVLEASIPERKNGQRGQGVEADSLAIVCSFARTR